MVHAIAVDYCLYVAQSAAYGLQFVTRSQRCLLVSKEPQRKKIDMVTCLRAASTAVHRQHLVLYLLFYVILLRRQFSTLPVGKIYHKGAPGARRLRHTILACLWTPRGINVKGQNSEPPAILFFHPSDRPTIRATVRSSDCASVRSSVRPSVRPSVRG